MAPLTVDEYQDLGRLARLRHRLEWGFFGAGAYYLREVWWNKMVRFTPPDRWRRPMRRDQAIVAVFALATLGLSVGLGGFGGVWDWVKIIVIPFLLFCQSIGWVVHVHHIQPEIRWWPRREWNRFRGQVEGTTDPVGTAPGWDFFLHWIMVHLPHHVDMRIPATTCPRRPGPSPPPSPMTWSSGPSACGRTPRPPGPASSTTSRPGRG